MTPVIPHPSIILILQGLTSIHRLWQLLGMSVRTTTRKREREREGEREREREREGGRERGREGGREREREREGGRGESYIIFVGMTYAFVVN